MPSGLANFVRAQGPNNNSDSSKGKDFGRRAAEAANAKVQPKVFDTRTLVNSQSFPDRRITAPPRPPFPQHSRDYEQNGGDLFAGSVLSDSDDTTRDFGSSDMHGYQAVASPQGRQNLGGRNSIEQNMDQDYQGEFGDDEEEHVYFKTPDALEDELVDGDGQSRSFHFPNGMVPIDDGILEQALRLRESQQFAQAEKLHNSQFSSNHIPPIHPSISGRFTAANNLVDELRRHPTDLGGTAVARHKSHLEEKDQETLDDTTSEDSNGNTHQENLQKEGHRHSSHLELTTRKRVSTERYSNGQQQARDGFHASELGSESSDGSSLPSPSQHTPRANGRSEKQTITSGQPSKRKKAELELDYDTNTLSTMKYSELKDQPFDNNPKASPFAISQFLSDQGVSLEDNLEHFKNSEPEDQGSFFAQMSLDQWEQAGDWFLGRFGEIVSRLKDARRAKRDVSKAFEDELAAREEAVRNEAEGIQEIFRQMKAGGEDVLKGRIP